MTFWLEMGVAGGGDSREDETITIQPLGVLGVELHELVEENMGNWGHSPEMRKHKCQRTLLSLRGILSQPRRRGT